VEERAAIEKQLHAEGRLRPMSEAELRRLRNQRAVREGKINY
jgi:hypothetical protein